MALRMPRSPARCPRWMAWMAVPIVASAQPLGAPAPLIVKPLGGLGTALNGPAFCQASRDSPRDKGSTFKSIVPWS